jgi:hypothetical protein
MAGQSALPVFITTVLGLLNVSAITTALNCAVYDRLPQGVAYPFIALQSPNELRDDQMGVAGKQCFVDVHVFTHSDGGKGSSQLTAIVSKVCELTDYPTVTGLTGFTCDALRNEGVDITDDEVNQQAVVKHAIVTIHGWFRPS